MRGASALDIALWDIFGQAVGQPIYQLLGGASRERVRTYNTCAGYRYVRAAPEQRVTNWGVAGATAAQPTRTSTRFSPAPTSSPIVSSRRAMAG